MKLLTRALGAALLLSAPFAQSADNPAADPAPLRAAAMSMATQLQAELKQALVPGAPENAVPVCRDAAPRIAGEISRQTGMKVSRVSLKPRNPLLGTPDAWEQAALQQLESRLAKGEKPETLELTEVVSEPGSRSLRFMKGIPVQDLCVACHGNPAEFLPNVKDALAANYPNDKATGYRKGMLRGALSVKKALAD